MFSIEVCNRVEFSKKLVVCEPLYDKYGYLFGDGLIGSYIKSRSCRDTIHHFYEATCEMQLSWLRVVSFCVLVLLLTIITAQVYRRWNPIGNGISSWFVGLLMKFCKQPIGSITIRSLFQNAPPVSGGYAKNHTHGVSAKNRNDSSSFADLFSMQLGKTAYFIQQSASDVRKGRKGCRTYHWSKDCNVEYSAFGFTNEDLPCIIDVDMYLDMPRLLAEYPSPYLVSTFQPTSVGKSDGDYDFTFDENNNVTYHVAGGATYKHRVWNYGVDMLSVQTRCYGIFVRHVVYNIDRRQTDPHHQIILLTPVRTFYSPLLSFGFLLEAQPLKYLNLVVDTPDGKFLRMDVRGPDYYNRSTGKPNQFLCSTIPVDKDETLGTMVRVSKLDLAISQVKTVLDDADQGRASVLVEFHRANGGPSKDVVYPVNESIYRYQYDPTKFEPDAKPSLTPFMSPIILGCYAPDYTKANDEKAVKGRIIDVKPQDSVIMTPKITDYINEFVDQFIGDKVAHRRAKYSGHPVSLEEIYERQNRPSQRVILEAANMIAAATDVKPITTFQKSEAYGKITEPRIISQVPGVNKSNYSCYTYSFEDGVKAQHWYAFGNNNKSVAEKMVALAQRATSTLVCTDLSRMDGRVSVIFRMLERALMLAYFKPQYHAELLELMATQKDQRAFTKFGVKYETGTARASGSPETSLFNSTDDAFMMYVTYRYMGYQPSEAYMMLGLYGGDDGTSVDLDIDTAIMVSKQFGQVLEYEVYNIGQPGVNFLARVYSPEIWHGSLDSMCDIKRQLSKFHTTPSLPSNITPMRKMAEKCASYYLSDKNTPILGLLCKTFCETFPEELPAKIGDNSMRGVTPYLAKADGPQYPNENHGNWMDDVVRQVLPDFDHKKFQEWCHHVSQTKERMLQPPVCGNMDIKHSSKSPVVVSGDIVNPEPALNLEGKPLVPDIAAVAKPAVVKAVRREYTAEEKAALAEKRKTQVCKDFAAGKCTRKACAFKHSK